MHRECWPWVPGIASLTMDQTVQRVVAGAASGIGEHVLTLNLDIYRQFLELPAEVEARFRASVTLVLADGMPIVWGSWLAGRPVRQRVTGADLLPALTPAALGAGLRVHFSGGPAGAAHEVGQRFSGSGGGATGLVMTSSYALTGDPRSLQIATEGILATKAQVVFLAYGFPKQDMLAVSLRNADPTITVIGCGAAFEFATGRVARAPRPLQRLGLEWLFRLMTEPRRLGHRYLVKDAPVLVPMLLAAVRSRPDRRPRRA